MKLRKNWLTSVAGIMAGLGTLPILVTASHVAFPLWWNSCQFPLVLVGMLGTILLGVAAKGVDEHSTTPQVEASTLKKEVDVVVNKADEKTPPTEVEIVNTPALKSKTVPIKPPAKPKV